MSELDRSEHDFFGKLLCFRFNHHHGAHRAGHDQVEFTIGDFFHRRVQLIFAFLVTDAGCTDWPHERDARNGQRSGGCNHRQDVGFVDAVIAQHLTDHVDFVVEAFWEQRTARTVDQTRCQRFLFRSTAFALEEAARNTTGG